MQTTLVELVRNMIRPINKTLDDVRDVQINEAETQVTVLFKDGTVAVIEIDYPKH